MPTQNLRAVSGASALSEALNSQFSPLILAICYDNTNKALSARDVANNLTIPILGNASDLQIAADGHVALANDLLQRVTVQVTSAQLKALHSTAVTLIAAPGAGKAILVNSMFANFVFGTVQYTGGGAIQLQYHGQATNLLISTIAAATIQAAANASLFFGPASTASGIVVQTNTGIDIQAGTADFAAGDGVLNVTLEYKVVAAS